MSAAVRACNRCGVRRKVNNSRGDYVCTDCREVELSNDHEPAPLTAQKYLHRFPIKDADIATVDLIREGRALIPRITPTGYRLERCEWHRRANELLLLADAVPEVEEARVPMRWERDGLIWRARRAA